MGFGTLEKFYAESAFSDPDNPSRPLWTANVLDVKTANKFPQIALKFGGWKSWFGGEMEMSYRIGRLMKAAGAFPLGSYG